VGKPPAFQFYTGDWLKDPHLSMCSPSTRGIWIDLMCAMWENSRSGLIAGTVEQLSRMSRCSIEEMRWAISELKDTETATVTVRNEKITLVNRRMKRDAKEREINTLRQQRYRGNGKSNAPVTEMSRPTSSSSTTSSLQEGSSSDDCEVVFGAWVSSLPGSSTRRLTPGRRKKIQTRLKEGWPVDELVAAVGAWRFDDWPDRHKHNDITQLLRSTESTEKWVAMGAKRKPRKRNLQGVTVLD